MMRPGFGFAGLTTMALIGLQALAMAQDPPRFPAVTGRSLEHQTFKLPADFEGERNLVLVAFKRGQQADVDSWMPFLRPLAAAHAGLRVYELPTLASGFSIVRPMIDGGMRGGIPDSTVRAATITLYIDKQPFRTALKITSEDRIHVFLVDRAGQVYWRAEGPFTQTAGEELARLLEP